MAEYINRSNIAEDLGEKYPFIPASTRNKLVAFIFEQISNALLDNKRVEIRGLGTFSLRTRKAGVARNPKTGEKLKVGERKSVYYRMGKGLKERINKK